MRRLLLAAAALCLAALGIGVIAWELFDLPASPASFVQGPSVKAVPRAAASPSARGPVLAPSPPTQVRIPTLGVSGEPVRLGLAANKEMEVPRRGDLMGWYTESPTPGALGPAVLAGHATYNGSKGVFFRLAELRVGDPVEVVREDGKVAVFRVTKVGQYSKDGFPHTEVYRNLDHAGLRLITCAKEFDPATRSHPQNTVVFGELVGVRQADRPKQRQSA